MWIVSPNNQLFLGCRYCFISTSFVLAQFTATIFLRFIRVVFLGEGLGQKWQGEKKQKELEGGVYIRNNITQKGFPKIYIPKHLERSHQIREVVVLSMALYSLIDRVASSSIIRLLILYYQTIPPASKLFQFIVGHWICGQKNFEQVTSTSLGGPHLVPILLTLQSNFKYHNGCKVPENSKEPSKGL